MSPRSNSCSLAQSLATDASLRVQLSVLSLCGIVYQGSLKGSRWDLYQGSFRGIHNGCSMRDLAGFTLSFGSGFRALVEGSGRRVSYKGLRLKGLVDFIIIIGFKA